MGRYLIILVSLLFTVSISACNQNTPRSAAFGTAGGVAASSLGTFVVGLISNDPDTGDLITRSAVYGAAAGAQKEGQKEQASTTDRNGKNKIREMTEEEFLTAVGPYNFSATLALRECKLDEAKRQALKAFQSDNRDFREASLWLQAVIASETEDRETLKNLYEQLAAYNPGLGQPDKAKAGLMLLLDLLHKDRKQHGLAPNCN